MYIKFVWFVLIVLTILQDVHARKSNKKRITDAEATPQPNVVTYSTFGFNDVGSYDGFIPSSPDFNNYLTASNKQESSTRLYAPAFPSAQETTGLGSYYDPQPDIGSFSISSDGYQTAEHAVQPALQTVFTSPNNDQNFEHGKKSEIQVYNSNNDLNSPIYGTKISSKNKDKKNYGINNTDYNVYGSVSSIINNDGILDENLNNNQPNVPIVGQLKDSDKYFMLSSPMSSTSLKFPKVVDFTGLKKYYPTSVESDFQEYNSKPFVLNIDQNSYSKNEQKDDQSSKKKLRYKDEKVKNEKDSNDFNYITSEDVKLNFRNNKNKNGVKVKTKPWDFNNNNNNNDVKHLINDYPSKGYDYSTNYSSTSFRFDSSEPKRPFNNSIDEIVPAGSSLDFVNYQFPEKEFSGFNDISNVKSPYDVESYGIPSNKYHKKYKPSEEYLNSFKNLFSTVPTTTSHWQNIFKTSDFSSYKNNLKKPFYRDDINDDVVHIPKRHQEFKAGKYFEPQLTEWTSRNKYKPYKVIDDAQQLDWTKNIYNTRFKSEEDLLGLRNHDTSHPSYVPNYKHTYSDIGDEFEYKKLLQKWRQNYIKSKYRDYETIASETKAIHVPLPRPYPIEVPRPVIIPVPQPYPVKVPIPRPVAVPVFREITVAIEKPVPYPVIKKVPYPIEKLVPVPVEKQVRVPVEKPYPVHVPQVRPVFHHIKPHDDRDAEQDEGEYHARPNYQRTKNSRNRPRPPSRRPSRTTYQDRDRRRPPNRRPHREQRPRPHPEIRNPHSYRDDFEEYESDSEYEYYCKRSGKC